MVLSKCHIGISLSSLKMGLADIKDDVALVRGEECVIDVPSCREDVFLTRMVSSINSFAPSLIYSDQRSKKKRMKMMGKQIHPELHNVWTNAANLFSPVQLFLSNTSNCHFPTVDWKSVNKRFLSNVPAPAQLPLFG